MAQGDNKVDLTIQAYNNTKPAFDALKNSLTELGGAGDGPIGRLLAMIGNIQPGIAGVVVAITAGVTYMVQAFTKTVQIGAQLYEMSQKTGIAVEKLSLLRYVADQTGTSMESLEKATGFFAKNIMNAADGGSQQAEYFKKLGINIRDTNGNFKDTDVLMLEVADRFKGMPDGVTKTALAMNLFGRSGKDMIPMLNEGSAGIQKMMARADALGLSFSKDGAAAAHEFEQKLKDLKSSSEGTAVSIGQKLLPAVIALLDKLSDADTSKLREQLRAIDAQIDASETKWGGLKAAASFSLNSVTGGLLGDVPQPDRSRQELGALRRMRADTQKMLDDMSEDKKKKRLEDEAADKKAIADLIDRNKERLSADQQFLKASLALFDEEIKTRQDKLQLMEELGISSEEEYYAKKNQLEVTALETKRDTLERELQAELDAWDQRKKLYKEKADYEKASAEVDQKTAAIRTEIARTGEQLEQKKIDKEKGYIEAAKKTAEELKKTYGEQEKIIQELAKYYGDAYDYAIKKVDELKQKSQLINDTIKDAESFLNKNFGKQPTGKDQAVKDYQDMVKSVMSGEANNPFDPEKTKAAIEQLKSFISKYKSEDTGFSFDSSKFEVGQAKTGMEELISKLRLMKTDTDQTTNAWQSYADKVNSSTQECKQWIYSLQLRIKDLDQQVAFNRELNLNTATAEASLARLLAQIRQVNTELTAANTPKGYATPVVNYGGDSWGNVPFADAAPSYASGTPYVRRSGLAFIHRGEGILTAEQNTSRGGSLVIQGGITINGATKTTPEMATELVSEINRKIERGEVRIAERRR